MFYSISSNIQTATFLLPETQTYDQKRTNLNFTKKRIILLVDSRLGLYI